MYVLMFILTRGRAYMSFISTLQGTTKKKTLFYLGNLGILFLQEALE